MFMKIAFHAMVQTLFSANIVFLCLLSRKEFMPKCFGAREEGV